VSIVASWFRLNVFRLRLRDLDLRLKFEGSASARDCRPVSAADRLAPATPATRRPFGFDVQPFDLIQFEFRERFPYRPPPVRSQLRLDESREKFNRFCSMSSASDNSLL